MDAKGMPWGVGAATGVGSLPHLDRDEAARVVVGELPDFPHVFELPGRGAGSDMIGRTAAMLVDLHVDLQPAGWRLVDRPGRDEKAATDTLRADLDALELALYGYAGPLKAQVTGPWTLAAALERSRGGHVLADRGARRDLVQSLAEGVRQHVEEVARRVPGAVVVVQVDEPALPSVLAGSVPTISGFGRLGAVPIAEAESSLATVLTAAGEWPVVHCCAAAPPFELVRGAGASALSFDVGVLDEAGFDELAVAVDAGLALWPAVVPALEPPVPPSDSELTDRLRRLFGRLDQDLAQTAASTVVTPACGLAGADERWARAAYALSVRTGRAFADAVGADR
ncbi:MAG TPA: methionine synthase [Jiangellaceae bacterium]|jgi:methionine synthase II (cobalamin-independent)|nr:methionine synthase [Jiangellaceae bacterium]